VQTPDSNADEKIKIIVQIIEGYREEIEKLKEKLNPTTPSKVHEQREQKKSFQTNDMAREAKEVAKIFDRTTKIWTTLEEDEKVQQLD
jgi:hypothetical protein